MLEVSVSEAQKQFSKIIKFPTVIIDKKNHLKKQSFCLMMPTANC